MSRKRRQKRARAAQTPAPAPTVQASAVAPARVTYDDGSKFFGGFGDTLIYEPDYWTLRARSSQLFETNLYARGLIRRLVTNVINTGLHLEATPEESILGYAEDDLAPWTEEIENRFAIWERSKSICDARGMASFGQLQRGMYMEALVAGDVLVTLRQHPIALTTQVHLVRGDAVMAPLDARPQAPGLEIRHGVEVDAAGRHVAYWITQRDGSSARMPAYGASGRRLAWLVYGTEQRLESVRGKPLLSIILQSLRELDRYRDAAQRKAVINSMIAMFVKREAPTMATQSITAGAVRRGTAQAQDQGGAPRTFRTADLIPGMVIEELQAGETPQAFPSTGTDEKYRDFEEAVTSAIAWAFEIPPEILRLSFSSNYSASQAAINEFKMFLNRVRTEFGESVCTPIYTDWLVSEALAGRVRAPRLLESWRDEARFVELAAWVTCDWSGHIKPAVDVSKLVKGYRAMVHEGFITRDRASRELTGTKYAKNVQKLRLENELLAAAREPILLPDAKPSEPDELDDLTPEQDEDDEPSKRALSLVGGLR